MWSNSDECGKQLAEMAVLSLIEEAELTPKPGLVDLRSSGSHSNMDISLMLASAHSLYACFESMGRVAFQSNPSQELREELALLGRIGEQEMMRVTQGVNTHRGAIWALGLLIAAAAIHGNSASVEQIAATAGEIAMFQDRQAPSQLTNGMRVISKYGIQGARGEAMNGFPHVIQVGLPVLQDMRWRSLPEDMARIHTLLSIMAQLDDSCLLHRGGIEALEVAQQGARSVLESGGMNTAAGFEAYQRLELSLLLRHVSPGGSADLLAAVLFLDKIQGKVSITKGGDPDRTVGV